MYDKTMTQLLANSLVLSTGFATFSLNCFFFNLRKSVFLFLLLVIIILAFGTSRTHIQYIPIGARREANRHNWNTVTQFWRLICRRRFGFRVARLRVSV